MLLRGKPAGQSAFGQTRAFATATKVSVANQGLYNGFLVAELYGAAIANRMILFIQALPAAVGLQLLRLVGG